MLKKALGGIDVFWNDPIHTMKIKVCTTTYRLNRARRLDRPRVFLC
jgi:hypothetical protein